MPKTIIGALFSWLMGPAAVTTANIAPSAVTTDKLAVVPTCILRHSAMRSVPWAANIVLDWDTADEDSDHMHDLTNPSRITINTAGVYLLLLSINWLDNWTGIREMGFVVNRKPWVGEFQIGDCRKSAREAEAHYTAGTISMIRRCSINDFIEAYVHHTGMESGSGVDLSVNPDGSRFAAVFVGK